jgi:processive 1,2-diacylglycerol beta-glucosyltransferase
MKKVLFFPLLNIPSGHHQVANAIIDAIKIVDSTTKCEVVELISYTYGKVETVVSKTYLNWIKYFPASYKKLYKINAISRTDASRNYILYRILFMRVISKILNDKKPDFLVCTHALPSYLLNKLKENNQIDIPILNVYTDYFINNIWGRSHIDYHFVPDQQFKEMLINEGVQKEKIYVTGIPVHRLITSNKSYRNNTSLKKNILITGGSMGCGHMMKLIDKIKSENTYDWYILCGENEKLFAKLTNLNNNHIIPMRYIRSKTDMADLYNKVDAIFTKPGGVTLSESIRNRIPIFIYHILPGQEEMNFTHFEKLNLAYQLNTNKSIGEQLKHFFEEEESNKFQKRISNYLLQFEKTNYINVLQSIL